MKPESIVGNCHHCGSECIMLALPQPNNDYVSWCEQGHVVVYDHSKHRPKVVHDFHEEQY